MSVGKVRVKSYVLPEFCDSGTAEQIKADLLRLRGADVEVDGRLVRRVGVLGLQVLLSAARTWSGEGRRLTIVGSCGVLADSFALVGLDREMTNATSVCT